MTHLYAANEFAADIKETRLSAFDVAGVEFIQRRECVRRDDFGKMLPCVSPISP